MITIASKECARCDFGENREVNACWDAKRNTFSCTSPITGEEEQCTEPNFREKSTKLYIYSPNAVTTYHPLRQEEKKASDIANLKHPDEILINTEQNKEAMTESKSSFKKLSIADRFLTVWILLAMIMGVIIGYYTSISDKLETVQISTVSLPIAIGLWLMMWPVLTKVRYGLLREVIREKGIRKQIIISVTLNWIVGPLLMTGLAWATLPDLPQYRNGLILVGVARCIAMVLIWNQLAHGDPEYCAILVAVNSILQTILYAPLVTFYLQVVSHEQDLQIGFWEVCRSVLLFLGVPLVAGIITRYTLIFVKGRTWVDNSFLPVFGKLALIALIYTVFILFSLQGRRVITQIGYVCRVSVPMICYFCLMWTGTYWITRTLKSSYSKSVSQAFTAASNNFELAIAIAVACFGVTSAEALAATIGPLIEVPAMLILVHVCLRLEKKNLGA